VVEGLAQRRGNEVKAAVSARSRKQKRFRMCRTNYLSWRAGNTGHSDVAATTGDTWRQQASRAFAAEILAPAELLKECAGTSGLTQDVAERLSSAGRRGGRRGGWRAPRIGGAGRAQRSFPRMPPWRSGRLRKGGGTHSRKHSARRRCR
jgi:hypothetical protein